MVIRMKMLKKKQFVMGCAAAVSMMAAVWCNPFISLAESEGTVTARTAYIREKPDTDSTVIGSSAEGKKITIKDKTTDASGTVWYRVYVDGNTLGYIRSDLVRNEGQDVPSVSGETEDSSQDREETAADEDTAAGGTTASTAETTETADGADTAPETAMDAQYASISVEAAKIRTAPSTNDGVVDRLEQGGELIISGQSNGSDGKVWYYVTFTGADGTEKTGYVRSDLVTLGDMLPVEEETPQEPVEEPEPTENVNHDYELKYEQDGEGYVWYLYDNVNQYKQKLEPILEAAALAQTDSQPADTDTVVKQRIIIVVLAVLLVALVITVTVMALKLRDVYYEDYEDDEEDEAEEEAPKEEVRAAGRRKRLEDTDREPAAKEVTYEEEPEVNVPVKTAPKRKAKNFLLDDDDFEFEFLNMDDKDIQ